MRAIIIEEDRFVEVLELMKKAATEMPENCYLRTSFPQLTETQIKALADDMFRAINYQFVRWAQSHGASCVQR